MDVEAIFLLCRLSPSTSLPWSLYLEATSLLKLIYVCVIQLLFYLSVLQKSLRRSLSVTWTIRCMGTLPISLLMLMVVSLIRLRLLLTLCCKRWAFRRMALLRSVAAVLIVMVVFRPLGSFLMMLF